MSVAMKKWEGPSRVVYRRFRKGIVFATLDFCTRFYRVGQTGRLETSFDWLERWSPGAPREAREAIAALWPPPTKDQLWRKVARLAGEILLIDGPDVHIFSFGANNELGAECVRGLIRKVSLTYDSHPAQLEKLKVAFAAWEAAK